MKPKDRFSIRLTGSNIDLLTVFMKNEPDIGPDNKSGAINLIISRYFLYERYRDFINAIENLIKRSPGK